MVRFLEERTIAPIVIAALCILSRHVDAPAGIVAPAPLLACSGAMFRFARERLAETVTVVAAAIALLVVLSFVGAGPRAAESGREVDPSVRRRERLVAGRVHRYESLRRLPTGRLCDAHRSR